jgi:hypothetical protein
MINTKKRKKRLIEQKLKKKGQIEIQFNWMFVLIAGGLILVFFTKLVLDIKNNSDQKIALVVMNDLETIATGAGVSKGTAQMLDKPNYDIIVDCGYDLSCDCNYKIGVNNKPFMDKRIFAPKRIVGEKMIAWTLDWSAPFRVNNYLLLTSPDVFYFLVVNHTNPNSKALMKKFNDTLPSQLEYEFINITDVSTIENYNYPMVGLIYLHTNINLSAAKVFEEWRLSHEEVKAVVLNIDDPSEFDQGNIQLYETTKNYEFVKDGSKMDFIGDESMFAAMFAGNFQNYACNVMESFERLEKVAMIYKQRADDLNCTGGENLLDDSEDILGNMIDEAKEIKKNVSYNYNDFYEHQFNLSSQNIQLQIKSCTTIY